MHDETSASTQTGGSHPADRPDTRRPARTRRLLDELRSLCGGWLHEPLMISLDHFEMRLQQLAERTRSHLDQQQYLATRQKLQNERHAFDRQFIASIGQAFDRLGQPLPKSGAGPLQTLSLLDPLEHEVIASLDQLVARSEARGGLPQVELGYRLAALIASPPLTGDALPVGPRAMARAFSVASQALGLPREHELLLLHSLESSLIDGLASLHKLINDHLQADGILPELHPFAVPRNAARRDRAKEPADPLPAAPAVANERGHRDAMPGKPSEPAVGQNAAPDAHPPASSSVTDEELQAALAALHEHFTRPAGQTPPARHRSLHEELLIQLGVARPAHAPRAVLSAAQDETMELIAGLFRQIAQQLPPDGDAQALLDRLQLPMLRAALADPRFFEQPRHPARRMLGKMVEIAGEWLDDTGGETARSVRDRLEQLIARAGREAPCASLHAALLDDIEKYEAQLQQQTQQAERRLVKAMHGLEQLEQARHRATALLAEHYARSSPQRLLVALLDRTWSDVLALTLLRHGEHSEIFGTRLTVTDQLLGGLPVGDAAKLQREVESGLRQIGMQADDAVQVARQLLDAGRNAPVDNDTFDADALLSRLSRRQSPHERRQQDAARTGGGDPADSPATATAAPNTELLRIHRHLRALHAGAWFEFVAPIGGRGKRRRLVWYSPLTGHSLFATRSGQRAEELGQLQLATEIANGRVRELPTEHEDVLDHAWRALARELGHPPRAIASGRTP
ncbi:MAG: DUF1631 family protein [Pseudomonadota bacterium]|nr:DUF1631 family protein [Pseudomonadota bacterium]